MDLKLENKVVVISGSTGGVGQALVRAFLAEGCKVVMSSTSQAKLDAFVPTLENSEGRIKTFVADLTNEAEAKALIEAAVDAFGTIDVLVPNQGWEGKVAAIEDICTEDFIRTYNTNVFSVMYMMKYAIPYMTKNESGAIVTIASNGSYTGSPTMSAYASSKHAVAGLMKTAALELGPKGIHCNFICPGAIDTPMILRIEENRFPGAERSFCLEKFASMYLNKRYCTAEEVANLALYLASPLSAHIMGSGIRMDGGLDAKD